MRLPIPLHKYTLFCLFWIVVLAFGTALETQATHIRAGEILARPDTITNNPLRIFFKLIVFTDTKSQADNPTATLFFLTGATVAKQEVNRTSSVVTRDPEIKRNVYYFEYTFPAPATYTVIYREDNRQTGVRNIPNSESQSFLLRTTIDINPFRGFNSSPELQVPPIDYSNCGQVFVHNPGAFDKDGDVLKFKLVTPLKYALNTENNPRVEEVSGYKALNDPSFGCPAAPNGGPSTLTLDEDTGQLTWNAPCQQGDYNVAFVVEEYRNGRKIGEVLRDMQIRVKCTPNNRPTLKIPKDTCVVAGTTLIGKVQATDQDKDPVLLEAFAKQIMPPATFVQNGYNGTFTWNTNCNDVQAQPYQVIFKVTDIPKQGFPLTDLQPWRIRVVGPAPQNFTVTTVGRNMVLNWSPYLCQNATVMKIYRHEGVSDFVPDKCETGIPASAGFVQVGEVNAKTTTTFTDNGGTAGLKRGVTYCYVIYATFPNPKGGESIATVPVCAVLENSVPLLTNVDVVKTDVGNGGIINVKWTKPRVGLQNLALPLQYRLSRAPGNAPTNFTEIKRTNNLDDTTFTDTGISTSAATGDVKWIYKIELYQNGGATPADLVDNSPTATSVQLKAVSRAYSIALRWTYDVPWDNTRRKHYIYRQVNNTFVLIDSVDAGRNFGQYVDKGTFNGIKLVPDQLYCYQVLTRGVYSNPQLKLTEPLLNRSQEFCTTLKDSVAPCPPVLSIDQLDCETFLNNPTQPPYQNVLTWVPDLSADCDQDIAYFTVYYRPEEEGEFDSIAFTNPNVTTYSHQNLESFAGCYVVTATDEAGNESVFSNTVCKDNCFFFQLPNIFTPNGDGKNDTFKPDRKSLFIKSIKFTVFSRLGEKVYEGDQDPSINWSGVNNAGKKVPDGIYYYMAEVEFRTLAPKDAKKVYKGWVEIVR